MRVTQEMRAYAEDVYGSAAAFLLSALERIEVGPFELEDPSVVARIKDRDGDRVEVSIERIGQFLWPCAYAEVSERPLQLETAAGLQSGWDLIAMTEASRFGWIS